MQKIALITDSSCDLTFETLKQYNIHMFPLRVIYKDHEYLDKYEIDAQTLYDSLATEIPTTSLPDGAFCQNLLEQLQNEGYTDCIIISISEGVSGTLNSIRLLCEDYPAMQFHFFDTLTLGFPVGAIAIQASKLIASGEEVEAIMAELPSIRERMHGFIAPDTLEYLQKGGRISKLSATIGSLFQFRPIFSSNEEGCLFVYDKARGRKQAFTKLEAIISTYLEKGHCDLWILHGDALDSGQVLLDAFKDHPHVDHLSLEIIGPSMGIHTGPGVVGFCIFENNLSTLKQTAFC